LAIHQPPTTVTVTAALASGTGLTKNGGAGAINGSDHSSLLDPKCPAAPQDSVAGASVPLGGYTQNGGASVPKGKPDIDYQAVGETLLKETGVDWESLSAGGGGLADYTSPPDGWPDYSTLPTDAWPVIYVAGDLSVGPLDTGRGTIIVRGDLQMSGSLEWDGLVLVGGQMVSEGNQTITGGMITGLNILLGESVGTSDIGNGTKQFLYNACYVKLASSGLATGGGMIMIPGSWDEEM
jgi:hypothetical protein